MKAKAHTMVSS